MARVTSNLLRTMPGIDWNKVDATTDADIARQITADPDAVPDTSALSEAEIIGAQIRAVRTRLRLTQPEFASRYRIPVGTVRDWEQGRARPDQPARAYLHAIARTPDAVADAVADMP